MLPLDPNLAAMHVRNDHSPLHRRLLAKVATTVAAWVVAFLVVTALLSLFGDQLAALPLAVRALIMSGVLVTLMVNLAMPVVGVGIGRLLAGPPTRGGSLTEPGREVTLRRRNFAEPHRGLLGRC
jgi:antibiotic biosynthesis monooxygenase (ABM) superfamily enzyme